MQVVPHILWYNTLCLGTWEVASKHSSYLTIYICSLNTILKSLDWKRSKSGFRLILDHFCCLIKYRKLCINFVRFKSTKKIVLSIYHNSDIGLAGLEGNNDNNDDNPFIIVR